MNQRGYILMETAVAILVLSIGIIAVQRSIRNAITLRGLANDYTQARFLTQELIGEALLQPRLEEKSERGNFEDEFSRFRWERKISRIDIPVPPPRFNPLRDLVGPPRILEILPVHYMGKVSATIFWTRQNIEHQHTMETLFRTERLWVPEDVEGNDVSLQ